MRSLTPGFVLASRLYTEPGNTRATQALFGARLIPHRLAGTLPALA
jgi:hypothetical protein